MNYKIGVISGDGIGPEIVREARKVLDAVCKKYGHEFTYTDLLLGGASIDVHGVPLTDETIENAKTMRCRADGLHRRRCKDLSVVQTGAVQASGSRTSWYPQGTESVRKS